MLKFNQPELEELTLKSLANNTSYPYKLTVYDNSINTRWIGQVWNELIGKSDCEYICLLNSDVIVTPDWLNDLMKTFETDEKIGIVGPSTNACGSEQKVSLEYALENKGKYVNGGILSGFCLLFKKKVWEDVGGFDEEFELYGQDSFFIWKAIWLGWKSIWNVGVWIYHAGRSSILKAEKNGQYSTEEQSRKAQELYRRKIQSCDDRGNTR